MSIELEHSFNVPVPPDRAWNVLLDVQRVAPCMPGATVESVDGDQVSGKIKVKVGPIALTYTGKATFTERDDAARSVRIEAAGKETRGAGTASATVLARLSEEHGQTRVNMHTTLNVTGRPAQFGRGVMAEVSSKIIEQFSANLAGQLAGGESEPTAPRDGQVTDSRMAIPIQELNLAARSFNTLKGEGIDTVGELVSHTAGELLAVRNLGEKSVGEIEQRLGDLGLSLAGQAEAGPPGADRVGRAEAGPPGAELAAQSEPGRPGAERGGPPGAERAAASSGGGAVVGAPADSAVWDGARPVAWPGDEDAGLRRDEPEDDALNLLDMAAGPILKRALPALIGAAALIWLGTRLRRGGRRSQAAG